MNGIEIGDVRVVKDLLQVQLYGEPRGYCKFLDIGTKVLVCEYSYHLRFGGSWAIIYDSGTRAFVAEDGLLLRTDPI